jgi:hypothetical protein
MQYFAIAMTALLVTTKSPKDCEDGWFTGYLITLSMFSICVFLTLLCYAICEGLKLKTKYYMKYFYVAIIVNLVLIFFNFLGNALSGNDCGVYSVRGFAAALISICTACSCLVSWFMYLVIYAYEKLNNCLYNKYRRRITEKVEENEEEFMKKVENTYDKANKINSFRDDFYAITFLGYVYLTEE